LVDHPGPAGDGGCVSGLFPSATRRPAGPQPLPLPRPPSSLVTHPRYTSAPRPRPCTNLTSSACRCSAILTRSL
jgi:hypothetical protein